MNKKVLFIVAFLIPLFLFASTADTIRIYSKSMDKLIPNIVVLPESYSPTQQYPTLYLLHGADGDYTDWLSLVPQINDYADLYNILIVCPDGASTSWYFDSPIDESFKYETYISQELIGFIDDNYNTIPHKSARAITGLSMGGHGAFYLAFKHQDIWGAAGSMSGGVDIRPFPNNWDLPKRLGAYEKHKDFWEQNTVLNLVHKLRGDNLKLIFDCGVDDFFFDVNKKLHKKLIEKNIPHDYIERPGGHTWDYWANALKYQLLFFNDFFESQKGELINNSKH